jgi:uncharacterized protein
LGLPYYDARMTVKLHGEMVRYESQRIHSNAAGAELVASYRPTGAAYYAAPGSFDHWLTERYCLYSALKPGLIVYGDIHHPPWSLQPAEAEISKNTMTRQIAIDLPSQKPTCHFARCQEVVAWPIRNIEKISSAFSHNTG